MYLLLDYDLNQEESKIEDETFNKNKKKGNERKWAKDKGKEREGITRGSNAGMERKEEGLWYLV
jgi:hypothetical protein